MNRIYIYIYVCILQDSISFCLIVSHGIINFSLNQFLMTESRYVSFVLGSSLLFNISLFLNVRFIALIF